MHGSRFAQDFRQETLRKTRKQTAERDNLKGKQMTDLNAETLGMVVGLSSLTLIPFFVFIGMVALFERSENRRGKECRQQTDTSPRRRR